jgi:hypothetical protein
MKLQLWIINLIVIPWWFSLSSSDGCTAYLETADQLLVIKQQRQWKKTEENHLSNSIARYRPNCHTQIFAKKWVLCCPVAYRDSVQISGFAPANARSVWSRCGSWPSPTDSRLASRACSRVFPCSFGLEVHRFDISSGVLGKCNLELGRD